MKIDIPAFKFVDGDTTIASFETYDQLYKYCRGNENMMGVIMASAEIFMLFGEVPLKYDVATNRLYSLGWREIGTSQAISGNEAEK